MPGWTVRLQKQSWVLKPQTGPGERGWSPVWFAFGALVLRQTFTNGREGGEGGGDWERDGRRGRKKSPWGWCQVKVLMYWWKHFSISLSLSLALTNTLSQSAYPQLWEFHGISVIACLYLRNALSGLRALLISGGLDWLLSAEHTQ